MKYYLHDTSAFQDEKITELFMQFGYEGVGLFFTILEKLAMQEKPIKTSVLKKQLFVGKRLEKCWSFMENCGLIYSTNGETFNENILKFSEKYQVKKEKNRERISKWRENQALTKNVTRYESVSNTPKVNKSKVKESNNLQKLAIATFCEFYEAKNDTKFLMAGKEAKSLQTLTAKIKKKIIEGGKEATDEYIIKGLSFYLESIKDAWVLQNFTPAILNSKFNELFTQAKNGTATSKKSDVTADYLAMRAQWQRDAATANT